MNARWSRLQQLLERHLVPAQGCTEPVAAALAAAQARVLLAQRPERALVRVSANLFKNAMAVQVPGTGRAGLAIAAAAGALGGNADAGLQVLAGLTPSQAEAAQCWVDAGGVQVSMVDSVEPLFCEVELWADGQQALVRMAGRHDRPVYAERNGQPQVMLCEEASDAAAPEGSETSVAEIFRFATEAPISLFARLAQAAELNEALSDAGLKECYGLQVGRTIDLNIARGLLANDLAQAVTKRTAAASDARMGGVMLPAMSNSGSGNQGIAATVPVTVCARRLRVGEERMLRALALSHLLAIHIRLHLAPLSALCAAITASAGASGAICWLLGGDQAQVEAAVTNLLADLSGVFCDGAKPGCALKVSSGAGGAVKAALLALQGIRVDQSQGIVATELEQTIDHLALLGNRAMLETDRMIIRIMQEKAA